MSISKMAEMVLSYARNRKEQVGDKTLHILVATRSERLIAALSCGELDPLLRLTKMVGQIYGAEALAIVVEGSAPAIPVNPVTGEQWNRGDVEDVRLHYRGVKNRWVTEAQLVTVATREGEIAERLQRFETVGQSIHWSGASVISSNSRIGSRLAEAIVAEPKDPSRLPEPDGDPVDGPFVPEQLGRLVMDVGGTQVFGEQLEDGEARFIVSSQEEADYYASEGLPSWQIEVFAS